MEIGSILFVLALVILTGAYVTRPLAEPTAASVGPAHPQLSRLQARRERLLDAIRELDSDHAMGKVLPEEYRQHRRQLTLQGAAVLRQIDELTGGPAPEPLEVELEARVARLKEALAARPHGRQGLPSEPGSAAAGAHAGDGGEPGPAGHCPNCGAAAKSGDRFCVNCGAALQEQGG